MGTRIPQCGTALDGRNSRGIPGEFQAGLEGVEIPRLTRLLYPKNSHIPKAPISHSLLPILTLRRDNKSRDRRRLPGKTIPRESWSAGIGAGGASIHTHSSQREFGISWMLLEGIWDQLDSQILNIPGGNAELSPRESQTSHWSLPDSQTWDHFPPTSGAPGILQFQPLPFPRDDGAALGCSWKTTEFLLQEFPIQAQTFPSHSQVLGIDISQSSFNPSWNPNPWKRPRGQKAGENHGISWIGKGAAASQLPEP